jgi:hypothetical protein
MILKLSTRAGSKQLANHLLLGSENEQINIHEVRGFVAQDLQRALQEIYATSKATKVKSFMASMSVNPPIGEKVSIADFEDAINRAEATLKLSGQPRGIVFHEKEGRRHAHVVWSRIDENLKAIKLPYYKKRLFNLSKELYIEHGWELPKGFQNKQDKDISYNLAEGQQAKRNKLNAKEVKARLIKCWDVSNDLISFKQALSKEGYILAKGDKKNGFVLLDINGEIKGLRRTLSVKAKDITEKLGASQDLPTVEGAKTLIAKDQQQRLKTLQKQLTLRHSDQLAPHKSRIAEQIKKHIAEREELKAFHEQRQNEERQARQAQYQKGLKALWSFVTGKYSKQKQQHEAEYQANLARDAAEQEKLIARQLRDREALQQPLNALKEQHQSEVLVINASFIKSLEQLGLKNEFSIKHGGHENNPSIIQKRPPELEL